MVLRKVQTRVEVTKFARDPRCAQEALTKTLARMIWVLVVVAVQEAARGNEDAGDALVPHDQRHAPPLAEVNAREGGDVLGLAVHDTACRVCERPSKQVHGTKHSWKGVGVARLGRTCYAAMKAASRNDNVLGHGWHCDPKVWRVTHR